VPAAGRGARVGAEQNKILLPLWGKPLLVWTLQALDRCPFLTDFVVAVQEAEKNLVADLLQRYTLQKSVTLMVGGAERQDSVRRALQSLAHDCPFVLVHDAARPLVTPDLCGRVVEAAAITGAAIAAVPCTDTVKVVDARGRVERTLDRRALHLVQTPQVFRTDLLRQAHLAAQRDAFSATDDAALVERLGYPVQVVMGSYDNVKITEARDFAIAESLLKMRDER
jgi:2-C-methyl-D-erythritol 4-phosphate cytidylyltransferase